MVMLRVERCYLVEVLMEAVHEEQQQFLRVLLVIARKLLVDLAYGDLKVPWADALVQTGPQCLHDHTKLLCHLPFVAEDIAPSKGTATQVSNISPMPNLSGT